ncbi:MAG: T9SS type A sorting domain-containing protein [Ignavibacterium sp.]|nr:T9SS type A sorting domain-containing protein [Ignavibacterium sp.]
MFWKETEPNQNQNGITGQKFASNGTRQWTDNGKIFKDLSAPNTISISYLTAEMGNGRAYLFYLEGNSSGLNDKVEGFACDGSGNFLWPGNFTVLSNPTSDKLQLVSTVDVYKNCKLAWGDNRLDASGIYAQDINPNGELGNSVVPVELVSFSADVLENSVVLNWATATEINNLGFEIEHSINNQNFRKIGFVPGSGTTAEMRSYSFVVQNVSSGIQYYRLKQVDFSGSSTLYNSIEVTLPTPDNFVLYQNHPNPFNPSTTISFSLPVEADVTVRLFNMLGQEITKITEGNFAAGIHKINFDAQNLSSGVYVYTLETSAVNSAGFKSTKKMLLLR